MPCSRANGWAAMVRFWNCPAAAAVASQSITCAGTVGGATPPRRAMTPWSPMVAISASVVTTPGLMVKARMPRSPSSVVRMPERRDTVALPAP